MIFVSKTPRDLNHDPEPMVEPSGRRAGVLEAQGTYGPGPYGRLIEAPRYDPRPEFDHAQHNRANIYLTWFRAAVGDPKCGTPAQVLDDFLSVHLADVTTESAVDREMLSHARRVLGRLASLTTLTVILKEN